MDYKIEVMQHNLRLIRGYLGWSAVELAKRLGCTRQLIQQLESRQHKMSQIQYLAIRYVLLEARQNGEISDIQWDYLIFGLLSLFMIRQD